MADVTKTEASDEAIRATVDRIHERIKAVIAEHNELEAALRDAYSRCPHRKLSRHSWPLSDGSDFTSCDACGNVVAP